MSHRVRGHRRDHADGCWSVGGGAWKGVVWRSYGCVVEEVRREIPVRGG